MLSYAPAGVKPAAPQARPDKHAHFTDPILDESQIANSPSHMGQVTLLAHLAVPLNSLKLPERAFRMPVEHQS